MGSPEPDFGRFVIWANEKPGFFRKTWFLSPLWKKDANRLRQGAKYRLCPFRDTLTQEANGEMFNSDWREEGICGILGIGNWKLGVSAQNPCGVLHFTRNRKDGFWVFPKSYHLAA